MSWLREDVEPEHRDEVEQLRSQVAGANTTTVAVRRQAPPKTSLALLLLVVVVAWAVVHFGIKSVRAHRAQATAAQTAKPAVQAEAPSRTTTALPTRDTAPDESISPVSHVPEQGSLKGANSRATNSGGTRAAAGAATAMPNARDAAPLRPPAKTPVGVGKDGNLPRQTTVAKNAAGKSPAPDSATNNSSPASAAPVVADGPGDKELRTGRQYLAGDGVPKNSAEGAKWLWKAVAARNTTAEMALAELYARGEGVAKNCEQAKILLDSAAKRGVEAAGTQLKQWSDSGCQ